MPRITVPAEFEENPAQWAHRTLVPSVSKTLADYSREVYRSSVVPFRVFEAARARIALINGCLKCIAWRSARDVPGYLGQASGEGATSVVGDSEELGEEFYGQIASWRESPLYSEQERVALELAEKFSLEPQALDDDEEFWIRAKVAFSDPELLSLLMAMGSFVANGRITHILQLDGNVCYMGDAAAGSQASTTLT